MDIKNVLTELAAEPEGTFLDLVPFNGSTVGSCNITGESPFWEMHPDTDEFFYIIEGVVHFELLEESGAIQYTASAGMVFSVPQGIWHKPSSPNGVKFIYITPGQTLHSDAEDPRGSDT